MSNTNAPLTQPLLVACLCAQWCGTCKDYAPLFEGLQKEFPGARFRWIDIEDESDLVDPMEVEDFPTLLIADCSGSGFFGTVQPHAQTLRRLIQAQQEQSSPLAADAAALHRRLLSGHAPGRPGNGRSLR